jgi:hypothetical protein
MQLFELESVKMIEQTESERALADLFVGRCTAATSHAAHL